MVQCVTSVDCDADLVESEHVLYIFIYIYVCVCELAGIGGCNLLHPIMYPYCHPTLPPSLTQGYNSHLGFHMRVVLQ